MIGSERIGTLQGAKDDARRLKSRATQSKVRIGGLLQHHLHSNRYFIAHSQSPEGTSQGVALDFNRRASLGVNDLTAIKTGNRVAAYRLSKHHRQDQRQHSEQGQGYPDGAQLRGPRYLPAVLLVGLYAPGKAFAAVCRRGCDFDYVPVPPGAGAVAVLA